MAIGIDGMSVADGSPHSPVVAVSFHRAPLALAQDNVFPYSPRLAPLHNGNVGMVAGA